MTYKMTSLLDESTLLKIHAKSLQLLEDVGVYVGDRECAQLLANAGGQVDPHTGVVRLPRQMVEEALGQITGSFDLFDLHGKRLPVPRSRPIAGARLKMPKYLDYDATTSRQVCRQDMINLARVTCAMNQIEWSIIIDCPSSDGHPDVDLMDALGLAYAITGHPVLTAPTTEAGMRMCIELAHTASGNDDLYQSPNLMICVNTTSPLQMAREECRILRCAVEGGVPIDVEPMTTAGGTTPFTLAGTLMVENAEVLFMLCLANTIRPGAKVMASTVGSIMNMRVPNLSLAAPESLLLASAEAAMTRLLGIPVMRMGGYCDSYYLDVQAGIEKAAFTLMIVLSGADMVLMGGPLNNAAHQSCESLIIDHDIWEFVERCTTEIRVDDETLAYETAVQVGIGGTYLDTRHTLRWLRSGEHYYGGSFNRTGRPGKENTMLARAHDRVEAILAQPFEFRAPADSVEKLYQYLCDRASARGIKPPEWPAT